MRNEIISNCSLAELDYVWKTGNLQNGNDEDYYFEKDSIIWEE